MGLSDFSNRNHNGNNGNNNGVPGNPNDPNGGNGLPPGGFIGIAIGPGGIPQPTQGQNDDDVMNLFINYNERYKNEPKVLFRDEVIKQLISILIGKNKPNGLLIGPAGTGKTAIVETIAGMLANNDPMIPDQLAGYTIWELPLANVVAGASLVGQLEENVKMVVAKMEDPNEKAILFIDEIHQIVSGSQTYDKIAQILKPALARGNMHVIGATTTQEARNLADDPAFNRRFSRVIVDELTKPQTIEVLKYAKQGFINHYKNIIINDDLLKTIADTADTYRPVGSHRPDNALTLLDRTVGEAVINRKTQIINLQNKVDEDPSDTESANLLNAILAVPTIPITLKQIQKTAISLATGNSKRDAVDMDKISEKFSYIKGQDDIKDTIFNIIDRTQDPKFKVERPTTMLFVGPSGVGKTEVTKIIAQELTGGKPIILNMTEYSDPATMNRILGSPAGFVGSDSNTELPFDKLESNPYQVILLDEFEKAHESVQRLFYSVCDEGILTTARGKEINFKKAIIIATSNAGYQEVKYNMGFGQKEDLAKATFKELSKFFDPALLNRFKHKIQFNPINRETYGEILREIYTKETTRIMDEFTGTSYPSDIPDDDLERLIEESYNEAFGARPAQETIENYIYDLDSVKAVS